jgi:hypothetical protein
MDEILHEATARFFPPTASTTYLFPIQYFHSNLSLTNISRKRPGSHTHKHFPRIGSFQCSQLYCHTPYYHCDSCVTWSLERLILPVLVYYIAPHWDSQFAFSLATFMIGEGATLLLFYGGETLFLSLFLHITCFKQCFLSGFYLLKQEKCFSTFLHSWLSLFIMLSKWNILCKIL